MDRKLSLTEREKGGITELNMLELSTAEIASRMNQSRSVVTSLLKDKGKCEISKKGTINKKLSEDDKRRLSREDTKTLKISTKLKKDLSLPVTSRGIRRTLS